MLAVGLHPYNERFIRPLKGETSSPVERARFAIVPFAMFAGAALGVAYGAALRAWMRLVSEDPEFTWAGTLFIVGAFTVSFALAGLVVGGRRRGWKAMMVPLRMLAIVLSLACFSGAGLVMLPTIVGGALGLARSDWPRWIRRGLVAVAVLSLPLAFLDKPHLSNTRLAVAIVVYAALVSIEIRVFAEPYRPTVGHLPAYVKVASAAVPVLAIGGLGAMIVGIG